MKIIGCEEAGRVRWDWLCDAAGDAWLFHRWDWVVIESRHFFPDNRSFALESGGRLVAVHPLYSSEIGLGSWSERVLHSGLNRHTGLAVSPDLSAPEVKSTRTVALKHIDMIADSLDADRIQLNVQNLAPNWIGAGRCEIPFWVEQSGYHLGIGYGPMGMQPFPGLATCCADQLVDLAGSEEDVFARLHESCRRAVRKATHAGVAGLVGDDSALDVYYGLAVKAAKRTGEAVAPIEYFRDVWGALRPSGRCAIVFASYDGEPAAAVLLVVDKGAASYLGGVSDPALLDLRINDFAHWAALRWARGQGLHTYRLGPWFPEVPPDWPIARVARFKTKFGARSLPILQGSLFRRPERYYDDAVRHLGCLCQPR